MINDIKNKINDLTKQLYPNGRAWIITLNSSFDRFIKAISLSEKRMIEAANKIFYSLIPDNDNFTEEDASRHESAFGIQFVSGLTLEARKLKILDKLKYPGDIPARQHYLYIQKRLRDLGFDLYVHENDPFQYLQDALYGNIKYNGMKYGQKADTTGEIVANYIDYTKDQDYIIGSKDNMKAVFFVGGQTYLSNASVDLQRREELRFVLLKIKPAYSVGIMLINYI